MKHPIPGKHTFLKSSDRGICSLREENRRLRQALSLANARCEARASQIERKYRLLIGNLPSIVYIGYADGSVEFFDDRIEALTGYSRSDFLTKKIRWSDIIIGNGAAASARANVKQALKTDHSYISDYRIRTKGGEMVWIEERGQIVCDDKGKIEFIVGSLLDITKCMHALEALHESEEKYRTLFISGPNPTFVICRETLRIADVNPMAEEIYGYTRDELIGTSCSILCSIRGEPGGCSGICQKATKPDECVESQKIRHYKRGKKPFYVKVKACPTSYQEKDAIILAVTDITEMLEKDARLIQANKMTTLGEMSAGIAHELNQPLTAIKMGSDFLRMMVNAERKIPEKDLSQVASEISTQVDRASEIIQQLRAFARKPDFEKEGREVHINQPIRNVLAIIGPQLNPQNIKVDIDLTEDIPPVLAHNNLLEQVFFNLITNARDAINQKKETDGGTAPARVISLHSFQEGDRVMVTISDTGAGIPTDTKDKIFEPFFTTKEVGKGMGLGLSIIYGIIKDFKGSIRVQSKEGEGTTFRLSFPIYSAEAETQEPTRK